MRQLLSDQAFERDALDFFPTPIADTLDEAVYETSSRAQRDKIVETFRVAVRLLGLMALAAVQDTGMFSNQLNEFVKKLLRKGLTEGEWVGLTREIVRPFASQPEKFAIPQLVSAFFFTDGKLCPVFKQQGACDKLLAMRKTDTVAHGVSGTEETAMDVLAARIPDFEVFLKELKWLWKVNFIVPNNRKILSNQKTEYAALKLMGVTPRRGFHHTALSISAEIGLGSTYAITEDNGCIELYPFIQYANAGSGQAEVFLFEEIKKNDLVLCTYPTGQKIFDAEALTCVKAKFFSDIIIDTKQCAKPNVSWSIDDIRKAAWKVSNDYLDKMKRERVYLSQLYARRLELELHLSGFLDQKCTKTGMLIVGSSGIGKTNTLCHIVDKWRADPEKMGSDVVLFISGSSLPDSNFSLRDVILDRLELFDNFSTMLEAFNAMQQDSYVQFLLIIDGVDKYSQPSELLRQLDDLIMRSEYLPWFKVVVSIGEITYGAQRSAGFIPAACGYYTITAGKGNNLNESVAVYLSTMKDYELKDAYEKYRSDPNFSPLSSFDSLSDEVKNAIRKPLFLRIIMYVFSGHKIPRRVLTVEVLLEYCNKKIFSEPTKLYFVNRLVDMLYSKQMTEANFDSIIESPDLRDMFLDTTQQSPYLKLLDEQVLEERYKRLSSILPPQKTVAFTYDRLYEYLLLNRIVERFGMSLNTIEELSHQACNYLPLRSVLMTLLLSKVGEGSIEEVAALLERGNKDIMRLVALDLLIELEQANPCQRHMSHNELAQNVLGRLITFMLREPTKWIKQLLIEFCDKLQNMGHYKWVEFIYEILKPLINKESEPALSANLFHGMGRLKVNAGQIRKALSCYEKALELYTAINEKDGQQDVLDSIGLGHLSLGNMSLAKDFFEKSLSIDLELVKTIGDSKSRKGWAQTLLNFCMYHLETGELLKAIEYAQDAKKIYSELGDKRGEAWALSEIGIIHRIRGFQKHAKRYHEKALIMHQQLGDTKGIAKDIYHIGIVNHYQGKWEDAFLKFNEALNIYEEFDDRIGAAFVSVGIGEIYRWSGRLDNALEVYSAALSVFEEIEGNLFIAMCLNKIGATYLFLGDAEKALDYLNKALTIHQEQLDSEGEPEIFAYLSAVALELQRIDESLYYSDQAVRISQSRRFVAEGPQLVYFYRYKILKTMGRDIDAIDALRIAYEDVIQQVNENIVDEVKTNLSEGFPLMENILKEWKRQSVAGDEQF